MGKASRAKREARNTRPPRDIATTVSRIDRHLAVLDEDVPGWYTVLDQHRSNRGIGLPDWPEWCLLPMAGPYAVCEAAGLVDLQRGELGPAMAALYAWRQGRSIYRFDSELAEAVVATDLTGEIPVDVFYSLPEWGIYIERPDISAWRDVLDGVLVHLEWEFPHQRAELRLVFDMAGKLIGIPLPLTASTITEMLESADAMAQAEATRLGVPLPAMPNGSTAALIQLIRPVVALVLYLCSKAADIRDPDRPEAAPVRRRSPITGPPRRWEVGYRISTALRAGRAGGEASVGTGQHVTPHLRRAHWHTYYRGEGSRSDPSKRETVLLWVAPVAVGAGDPITVVRRVVP